MGYWKQVFRKMLSRSLEPVFSSLRYPALVLPRLSYLFSLHNLGHRLVILITLNCTPNPPATISSSSPHRETPTLDWCNSHSPAQRVLCPFSVSAVKKNHCKFINSTQHRCFTSQCCGSEVRSEVLHGVTGFFLQGFEAKVEVLASLNSNLKFWWRIHCWVYSKLIGLVYSKFMEFASMQLWDCGQRGSSWASRSHLHSLAHGQALFTF